MSQKDLQASIDGGTLVRSMAHNMTVLQKYRGAMMEMITEFVNTPDDDAGGRRQRDGGRRRSADVEHCRQAGRGGLRARPVLRAIERVRHVESPSQRDPAPSGPAGAWRERLASLAAAAGARARR